MLPLSFFPILSYFLVMSVQVSCMCIPYLNLTSSCLVLHGWCVGLSPPLPSALPWVMISGCKKKKINLCIFRKKKVFVVDPASNKYYRWLMVVTVPILYNWCLLICRYVFPTTPNNPFTSLFQHVLKYMNQFIMNHESSYPTSHQPFLFFHYAALQ